MKMVMSFFLIIVIAMIAFTTLQLCCCGERTIQVVQAMTVVNSFRRRCRHRLLILGHGNIGRAVYDEAIKSTYFVNNNNDNDTNDCIQITSRSCSNNNNDDNNDDDNDKKKTTTTTSTIIPFEAETIGSALLSAADDDCNSIIHVLITIPPPTEDDATFDAVMNELKINLPRGRRSWIGLVSTTGVYGNHNGTWVTEDESESPPLCSANSPTVYRYILHEQMWRDLSYQHGWTCRIFRCSGLYGPQRSALHTLWKSIQEKGNVYYAAAPTSSGGITNRIHETDVARAIVSSMSQMEEAAGASASSSELKEKKEEFRVYNLADDEPETRTVVMNYAKELLESIIGGVGITIMDESETTSKSSLSPSSSSSRSTRRGTDIKRVSNIRMKQELIGNLTYPTYREGLAAIFNNRSNPWWRWNQKKK